ncbi:hypothetical protein LCGC14_2245830 [marine sediment metagenome]|uniref:LamG-like jellyroll fold domain-containing protein n=1 Tax=marine sediment metagenome TaxID=412755 RepID=A0A0F9DRL7_9ZZZZ
MALIQRGFLTGDGNRVPDYIKNGNSVLNKHSLQARGLVGRWTTFSGGGLTRRDLSEHGAPDAVPNDVTPNMTMALEGRFGANVMTFPRTDTVNDHLTVASEPFMGDNLPSTWLARCRVTDSSQARYGIIGRDVSFNVGMGLYFEGGATKEFRYFHGQWNDTANSAAKNYDQWYDVVATTPGDTGTTRIYVDGVEEGTNAAIDENWWSADMSIGSVADSRILTGAIAEVRWYDRVLNPSVIRAMSDPATIWDLDYETGRVLRVFMPAAPAGGFVPYPNPRYALTGGMQSMDGGV